MPGPYIFKQIFAADPSNTANVATNASILLFAPGDPAMTPVVITDASTGRILANPVETNVNGFGPTFAHETLDQVAWEGGGFKGTFESWRGLKDDAEASAEAASLSAESASTAAEEAAGAVGEALAGAVGEAEAAKVAAQAAAGLVGAPAGAAVLAAIQPGGAAHGELSAAYARAGMGGLVMDVTAGPYNAKGDGTTDDYDAINNAAAALETFGGGTLFLPKGVYRTSAYLRPRNYVRYQGAGIGRTVIKPYQSAAFTGHGTLAAPIEAPSWFDMTWDGSSIAANNSLKGQFSEYLKNAHWERVECKNFTATGFGSDFLPGGRYINCIASGNGRGQAVHDPGMSGFGIGTGKYEVEDVLVQGCIAFGNTNYGIFVEKQGGTGNTPYYSKGVRIIGNYAYGNAWGIGGCGVEAPVYSNNICANNSWDGITLHEGTGLAPLGQPDKRAVITGNQIYGNGRDGINIDYEKNSISANQAYHIISANSVRDNTRDGLRLVGSKWGSDVVRGIKIHGNLFSKNGGEGINIVSATGAEATARIDDLHIEDNDVRANGLNGIRISENLTRPVIRGNTCYDDQVARTQLYGILTDVGHALTDATVQGNTLVQNKTDAAKFDATWAGYTLVTGNKGYYPGWNNVTGASPITYVCGVTPETLYFTGSVTDVQFKPRTAGGFITMGTGGTGTHSFPLEPGDTVQISYTGAAASNGKSIKRQ